MSNLATKYRPKTFEDVTEQKLVVEIIRNMCEGKNLDNRNFLLIGSAGCGKTTLARIMANVLNEGKGEPIEIDAASHSGVEHMREIVQQAQTYPVGMNWKVFILDECFSGDTKVLTNKGFKRFDSLDKTELIAQYTDDGKIEFIEPIRYIHKPYEGDMIRFYPNSNVPRSVLMTPGHMQPIYNWYTHKTFTDEIGQTVIHAGDVVLRSGIGTGDNSNLSDIDKLRFITVLRGRNIGDDKWVVKLEDTIQVARFHDLLISCNVDYEEATDAYDTSFIYEISNVSIDLYDMFDLNMGYDRANQFVDELFYWTDTLREITMSADCGPSFRFLSPVLTLAGYAVGEGMDLSNSYMHKTQYDYYTPRIEHTTYNGDVYCVEVPSHKIIVQANGLTFVTGNCHALSSASWQSALKCLESSPAKSIFCFCTTNPEKIPATILSRVQTFQLSKISLNGIISRLKYVIECENKEGRGITYTEDAISFIAKLANGGMRDSLTLLDKALAYSTDLTNETLQASLNLPNYDDYFALLNACAKKDNAKIAQIIHTVYNSGVNFVKWFEGFHSFVINVVKYIFLQDINATMIPSHYADKISKYGTAHSVVCLKLANKLLAMNSELKSTQYLQEVALTHLCTVPTSGGK